MENLKTIGNVNILNLMNATEASVASIEGIGNVNFALFTPETAPLFHRIKVGNVNATIEVPSETSLVTLSGQLVINADFFKNVERKIFFLVAGRLIVEPGIPVEEIDKGLAGAAVAGEFFCPEDLMGIFSTKYNHVSGKSTAYPPFKHLVTRALALDEAYLNSLEDGAEISLLGDLSIPHVLAAGLLERKIGKLFVSGKILCHEENAQALRACLYKPAGVNIVPAGFEWIAAPLVLDNDTLEYLPGKKLFCKELVRIAADVEPSAFNQHVEQLIAEDLLLCPSALKPVLAQKCKLFETKAIFYQDELWLVQNEQTLRSARFDNLNGSATLVVTGELTLDAALPAQTLSARLSAVHNFGQIRCTPEQHAALRSHLSRYEGEFEEVLSNAEQPEKEEEQKDQIGNANILAL